MKNKGIAVLAVIAVIVLIAAGIVWYQNHTMDMQNGMNTNREAAPSDTATHNMPPAGVSAANPVYPVFNEHGYAKNLIKPREGQPVKKFSLTASEASLLIKDGLTIPVWTFNGTVPGQEIRVTQGDFVQVKLTNTLKDPVTIHWHGYPLMSAMDGVPGVNQDAVKPGETFTYEFSADVTGTYWYHSHQEGAKQVDKGLYGALVVEPKEAFKPDRDYTLILDEWMEKPEDSMDSMAGMDMGTGNDMPAQNDPVMAEEEMMADSYNIYTVNGKSGGLIAPLEVLKGDTVRLRFVNAGYRSHGIHIPGQDFKVVSTDGQDIPGAQVLQDQIILIAPGERYDIEFSVTGEDNFFIDVHDGNKYNDQLKIPVVVKDGNGMLRADASVDNLPLFDLTAYGSPGGGQFDPGQSYDVDYAVMLDAESRNGTLKYTINGQIFSELPPLKVKTGDNVKLTFENKSKVDHPMHIHGHFFEVLLKNDRPVSGAAITKDTLLVRPGEKYTVAFKADNTGRWVQHCHELHHAAAGMMQGIEYIDFTPNYTADPNDPYNKPE